MTLKERFLRLRNYDLAIPVAMVLTIGLDICASLLTGSHVELGLHNTIFNTVDGSRDALKTGLFAVSSLAASMSEQSYINRLIDLGFDQKTILYLMSLSLEERERHLRRYKKDLTEFQDQTYRNRGSLLGALIGLGFGIALTVLLVLTFGFSFPLLLTILYGHIVMVGACSGLFSRLGQAVDRKFKQHKTLNRNYELAIIVSFVLSAVPIGFLIFAFCTSGLVLTPLSILVLISSIAVMTSGITSGAHYLGRVLDFITGNKTVFSPLVSLHADPTFVKTHNESRISWRKNFFENTFTMTGLVLGLGLGIALLCLGVWMPPFLISLPLALKAPLLIFFAMNMCTSILSRVGRLLDRIFPDLSVDQTTSIIEVESDLKNDNNDSQPYLDPSSPNVILRQTSSGSVSQSANTPQLGLTKNVEIKNGDQNLSHVEIQTKQKATSTGQLLKIKGIFKNIDPAERTLAYKDTDYRPSRHAAPAA